MSNSALSPRTISILSGKGGVGKSVVAFNLADAMARQGAKVLLVDADFGCGNLHLLANVAVEFGIGEYASRQVPLREAVTTLTGGVDLLASTWNETLGEARDMTLHRLAASAHSFRRSRLRFHPDRPRIRTKQSVRDDGARVRYSDVAGRSRS